LRWKNRKDAAPWSVSGLRRAIQRNYKRLTIQAWRFAILAYPRRAAPFAKLFMEAFDPALVEAALDCDLKVSATALWHVDRSSTRRMLRARVLFALLIASILYQPARSQSQPSTDCVDKAALPPLATFGGPATAAPGHTELGLSVGYFAQAVNGSCTITDVEGASDWFTRWRRGMTRRTDLGFDFLIDVHPDGNQEGTFKGALRFQATQGLRLEGAIGAADGGDGRAVNGDLAAVIGTHVHPENTWNYYTSIRLAGSHGCIRLFCLPRQSAPGARPPGTLMPLGIIGATARVSDTARFVMEAGLGWYFSRELPTSDPFYHFSFGVQFNVGKDRKR
jgi:hypothetical protein